MGWIVEKQLKIDNLRSSCSKKRRLEATVESTPALTSNNLIKGHKYNQINMVLNWGTQSQLPPQHKGF